MTTLICQHGQTQRFWSIEQERNELHVRWGNVGSQGRLSVKPCLDNETAAREKDRLIKEKQRKGYVLDPSSTQHASDTAEKPTDQAPWLQDTDRIELPDHIAYNVLSHRYLSEPIQNNYVPMDKASALQCQQNAINTLRHWQEDLCIEQGTLGPEDFAHIQLAQQCLAQRHPFPEQSPKASALLASVCAATCVFNLHHATQIKTSLSQLMDAIVDAYGLVYATELIILKQEWTVVRSGVSALPNEFHSQREAEYAHPYLSEFDCRLRFHLSRAEEQLWQHCALRLVEALPSIPCWRRPIIALLLPEKPELADLIVQQVMNGSEELSENQLATTIASMDWLKLTATHPDTLKQLDAHSHPDTFSHQLGIPSLAASILREHGIKALHRLKNYPHWRIHDFSTLMGQINHPLAITALLNAADSSKDCFDECQKVLLLFPEAATAALAENLAEKHNPLWDHQLMVLLHTHPSIYSAVRPWISQSAAHILDQAAQRITAPTHCVDPSDLPRVLINPPWLNKKKNNPLPQLALSVLPLTPVMHALPSPSTAVTEKIKRAKLAEVPQLLVQLGYGRYRYKAQLPSALVEAYKQSDYVEFKRIWQAQSSRYIPDYDFDILPALPKDKALEIWHELASEDHKGVDVVMQHFGLQALDGFITSMSHQPLRAITTAMQIGATALAPIMARSLIKLKTLRDDAQKWLMTYPEHAITGVLPNALGSKSEAQEHARAVLLLLAKNGHQALILRVAARYERSDVVQATKALLAMDPLDSFPTKRPALPQFYRPTIWHRPCIESGEVLSEEALHYLGTMLRFPTTSGIYPGLKQVTAFCTPESLEAFAWDLFLAWLAIGAPPKESWAFTTLGLWGNDETARKLTPLIRSWPGKSQHKRAVTGLEVLAQIGTDIALMQLNGIALKIKFKGLREKAQQKIAQIAEQRELTVDELGDRIVPDLGLDKQGSITLDFGSRQFIVRFDEALKPFICDMRGRRFKNLPRPGKNDDLERSNAAVNCYKALKKDARMVIHQQLQRLESAMCQQRRWTREQFRQLLVEHPLVGHLTRHLIWATYDANQHLTHCFRVAEDNTYTTADDSEFLLPESTALIGIPHRLEISEQNAAAFGQLFANYELLLPVSQLDRTCYHLTAAEREATLLERWKGRSCPSARLLGMPNKGWLLGEPQDGGCVSWLLKPMGEWTAILGINEGLYLGRDSDEYHAEQTINSVGLWKGAASRYADVWDPLSATHTFSVLSKVAASELLNDIEALLDHAAI